MSETKIDDQCEFKKLKTKVNMSNIGTMTQLQKTLV